MILRLQLLAFQTSPTWHTPFHRDGTGGYPSSLKLLDSGQIPDEAS
jgi:hypothetical protein